MSYFDRVQPVAKTAVKKMAGNPYRDALGRFTSEDMAVEASTSGAHTKAMHYHTGAAAMLRGHDNQMADDHMQAARAHQMASFARDIGHPEAQKKSRAARDLSRAVLSDLKRRASQRDARNMYYDQTPATVG